MADHFVLNSVVNGTQLGGRRHDIESDKTAVILSCAEIQVKQIYARNRPITESSGRAGVVGVGER